MSKKAFLVLDFELGEELEKCPEDSSLLLGKQDWESCLYNSYNLFKNVHILRCEIRDEENNILGVRFFNNNE